jgi:hypothetical protein
MTKRPGSARPAQPAARAGYGTEPGAGSAAQPRQVAETALSSTPAHLNLSTPSVRDDELGEAGLLLKAVSVDRRGPIDDRTHPIERFVAELDDPQIRPSLWLNPQDLGGNRRG